MSFFRNLLAMSPFLIHSAVHAQPNSKTLSAPNKSAPRYSTPHSPTPSRLLQMDTNAHPAVPPALLQTETVDSVNAKVDNLVKTIQDNTAGLKAADTKIETINNTIGPKESFTNTKTPASLWAGIKQNSDAITTIKSDQSTQNTQAETNKTAIKTLEDTIKTSIGTKGTYSQDSLWGNIGSNADDAKTNPGTLWSEVNQLKTGTGSFTLEDPAKPYNKDSNSIVSVTSGGATLWGNIGAKGAPTADANTLWGNIGTQNSKDKKTLWGIIGTEKDPQDGTLRKAINDNSTSIKDTIKTSIGTKGTYSQDSLWGNIGSNADDAKTHSGTLWSEVNQLKTGTGSFTLEDPAKPYNKDSNSIVSVTSGGATLWGNIGAKGAPTADANTLWGNIGDKKQVATEASANLDTLWGNIGNKESASPGSLWEVVGKDKSGGLQESMKNAEADVAKIKTTLDGKTPLAVTSLDTYLQKNGHEGAIKKLYTDLYDYDVKGGNLKIKSAFTASGGSTGGNAQSGATVSQTDFTTFKTDTIGDKDSPSDGSLWGTIGTANNPKAGTLRKAINDNSKAIGASTRTSFNSDTLWGNIGTNTDGANTNSESLWGKLNAQGGKLNAQEVKLNAQEKQVGLNKQAIASLQSASGTSGGITQQAVDASINKSITPINQRVQTLETTIRHIGGASNPQTVQKIDNITQTLYNEQALKEQARLLGITLPQAPAVKPGTQQPPASPAKRKARAKAVPVSAPASAPRNIALSTRMAGASTPASAAPINPSLNSVTLNTVAIFKNNNRIDSLSLRMQRMKKDVDEALDGVALSIAMGAAPKAIDRNSNYLSVGTGSYAGHNALALSFSHRFNEASFSASLASSGGEKAVGLGLGIAF